MTTSPPAPSEFLTRDGKHIDTQEIEKADDERRFDLIAAAFTYLLNRSDGKIEGFAAYSLTYDWSSLINVLNIQKGSLLWLRDAVELLKHLFNAGYTFRMPDRQYIPVNARPEEQHAQIKSVVEMGCNLYNEWIEHFGEFLDFLYDTPGGERSSAHNIMKCLEEKKSLSKCYEDRIKQNLDFFARLEVLRKEYDRLHFLFSSVFRAPRPDDSVNLRGLFYHPHSGRPIAISRHPGMRPWQWHTYTFLLESEFNLEEDLIDLGGNHGSYHICYRA